jgi:hypothetical protein
VVLNVLENYTKDRAQRVLCVLLTLVKHPPLHNVQASITLKTSRYNLMNCMLHWDVAVLKYRLADGVQDVEVIEAIVDLHEVQSYRAAIASLQEQASSVTRIPCINVAFSLCGSAGHCTVGSAARQTVGPLCIG